MITTLKDTPNIGIIKIIATFTAIPAITKLVLQNNTGHLINITPTTTGKYGIMVEGGIELFKANKTVIYPQISDWAVIPLSKTVMYDYSYHFLWLSPTFIELVCQKTSDISYRDFTDVFDGIKIPIHIEIHND